jgi:hypothetical protein
MSFNAPAFDRHAHTVRRPIIMKRKTFATLVFAAALLLGASPARPDDDIEPFAPPPASHIPPPRPYLVAHFFARSPDTALPPPRPDLTTCLPDLYCALTSPADTGTASR